MHMLNILYRYKAIPLIFILTIVIGVVYLHAVQRQQDFIRYQNMLSQTSTEGLANQVRYIINEQKRMVKLFANQNAELLKQYAFDYENEALFNRISARIKKVFPDYFAFTITDSRGEPYPPDFDNFIGELCINDIKQYAKTGEHHTKIHPNIHQYHYDIIGHIENKSFNAILLISFSPIEMMRLINNFELPGHQLMLVRKVPQFMIEVVKQGARSSIPRSDYRFSKEETQRILNSSFIKGTDWYSIDLYEKHLFSENRMTILKESATIIFMLLLVIIINNFYIQRVFKIQKQLNEEKERQDFIATISHELRSPLTSISGSLQLILNLTSDNEKTKQLAKIGIQGCSRILRLINNLVDSYKLRSHELAIKIKPDNIIDTVRVAVDEMKSYASSYGSNLDFINATNKDSILIPIDKERIIQVLINLISNAIKYGKKQDKVLVSLSEQKDRIRIEVTDHGPGIPSDLQDKIFRRFTSQDNDSDEHARSSGLGLSISKDIINRHSGIINYTSQEKMGTTFYIILPKLSEKQ